jgi:hypothetical protein
MARAIVLALLLVSWSGVARAGEEKPPERGAWESVDLSPDMRKMTLPGEGFQSNTLVAVAYGFIWVMLCGFVVSVWMRGRKVEREMAELSERIARGAKK